MKWDTNPHDYVTKFKPRIERIYICREREKERENIK